jgi:hypothetical protein
MKFVELRSEDGEECFCVNVDAIAYTKVNKSKAADVEIFLRGASISPPLSWGRMQIFRRDAMGLKPWSAQKA